MQYEFKTEASSNTKEAEGCIKSHNITDEVIKIHRHTRKDSEDSGIVRPPRPLTLTDSAKNSLKKSIVENEMVDPSSSLDSLKLNASSDRFKPSHIRSRSDDFQRSMTEKKKIVSDTLRGLSNKVNEKVQKIKSKQQNILESGSDDSTNIKFRHSKNLKDSLIFNSVRFLQKLSNKKENKPVPIWTVKFSPCSRLLATGGQDKNVYIWILTNSLEALIDMSKCYMKETDIEISSETTNVDESLPFQKAPFRIYTGHTSDILDLSWSKNLFLISSSMDKTVRLWNVLKNQCLCIFQHNDFVSSLSFCPKDDKLFVSGSMDGTVRIWDVTEKKLSIMCDIASVGNGGIITAVSYVNCGNMICVGTYDGRCLFFTTELRYKTQIHVSKHKTSCKVTGIESLPGEDKILVTSNDCKIRLFNLTDLTCICEYRGIFNNNLQIKAITTVDGSIITSGSEDGYIYCWNVHHGFENERRDRNNFNQNFSPHLHLKTNDINAINVSNSNALFIPSITSTSLASFSNVIVNEWIQKTDNCFKIYNSEVIAASDQEGDIYLLFCVLPSSDLSPSLV